MQRDFFQVVDDLEFSKGPWREVESVHQPGQKLILPDRWFLGELRTAGDEVLLGEEFSLGSPAYCDEPVRVNVDYDGEALDFTFGPLDAPVLNRRTRRVIEEGAFDSDVQWINANVLGRPDTYYIMNIASMVDCLDHARSEIEYWPNDNETPLTKVGKPLMIIADRFFVDPSRIPEGVHIFRVAEWPMPLVVSYAL